MTLLEIARLLWRHKLVVFLILVVSAGAGARVMTEDPVYESTAGVWYVAPSSDFPQSPFENFSPSLIVMGELSVTVLNGPHGHRLVREHGGTADFEAELVNHGNLETPYHDQPYVTLTVSSRDPVEVNDTMRALVNVLHIELEERQAKLGAREKWMVTAEVLTRSVNPTSLEGRRSRSLGALALLSLVSALGAALWAERRRTGGPLGAPALLGGRP